MRGKCAFYRKKKQKKVQKCGKNVQKMLENVLKGTSWEKLSRIKTEIFRRYFFEKLTTFWGFPGPDLGEKHQKKHEPCQRKTAKIC